MTKITFALTEDQYATLVDLTAIGLNSANSLVNEEEVSAEDSEECHQFLRELQEELVEFEQLVAEIHRQATPYLSDDWYEED